MSLPVVLCVPSYAQATSEALRFIPVTPCRVLDTRLGTGPLGGPVMSGGSTREFPFLISPCSIPQTAQAYSVNVTVAPREPLGYLSIWPTGQAQPLVSTLNSPDGRIKANAAIVPAGTNGSVSVFVSNTTDVVIDINGYYVSAATSAVNGFVPVPPCRIMDTRGADGPFGGPFLPGGQLRVVPVANSNCGPFAGVAAYSLNVTVVPRGGPLGYLTAWPAGQSQPLVSTLNAPTGAVTANAAIVPAGDNGAITIFGTNDTDVVIDINGYFTSNPNSGLSFFTVTPCRAVDTRNPPGPLGGPSLTGQRDFNIAASTCGIPSSALVQSLNATVVPQGPLGYLALGPVLQSPPMVSTLNSLDGTIVSNAALALTPAGTMTAFASGPTDLIVDVNGFFASGDPLPSIIISSLTVGPGQSAPFPVILSAPAPAGGVTVTLTSSDPSKATATSSVFVPAGATTPATQPQVTGVSLGVANITATAPGYTPATRTVQVSITLIFSPTNLSISGIVTGNLALTLSTPAPSGGLTINLSSDNTLVATIPPAATFGPGVVTIIVPVTGVAVGSTVIRASASGIAEATANVTVARPGSITLPSGVTVGTGQSVSFPVTLSTPAPAGAGVTVTLISSDPSRVTVTSSVVVPAGATTPTTQPQVTGIGLGLANITATAPGYTPASQTVQADATPVFTPNTVTITGTTTQNLMLILPAPAPAGGLTVNLNSDNVAVATVPATTTFAAGATTANVPVTGVAPGSTVIRASGPNIMEATASVTVANPGTILIPTGLNVGLGLSAPFPVTLTTPAPAGGVTVTFTADPSRITVTSSVVVPAGATTPTTQAQVTGVNLGPVNITVTAPGYTPAGQTVQVNATVVFSPANLPITGTATANLTLTLSAPAPAGGLTINVRSDNPDVARVPATVAFAAGTTTTTVPVTGVATGSTVIRASAPNVAEAMANVTVSQGGIVLPSGLTLQVGESVPFPITLSAPAPASGVTVTLASSNTSLVTITSTVVVPAGATTPVTQPQVTGVATGTASITASAPGYAPAGQAITVVPMAGPPITVGPASVGQNLQTPVSIQFPVPTPAGSTNLTVTSGDPTRLVVAASEGSTGSGSINLAIPQGATSTTVYAQALAGSGTVALNAAAPNYGPGSGATTLTPSGFVFIGPNGPVANFSTDQGVDTAIPVSAARLDAALNFVAVQQVRPGLSVPVNLTSSDTAVGTITSPVTFTGPADSGQARFTAVSPGGTTLTTGTPAGFSTPNQNASVTIQVNATSLSIDQTSIIIGQNLETDARVLLGAVAPDGGLTVTVTSSDPSRLLLSTDPAAAGSPSISFSIAGGSRGTPTFYVQALGGSGNATYTASASGFGNGTQTVTLASSGFVIASPFGLGADFFTTIGAPDQNITVFVGVLNGSQNFVTPQLLRGGFSASVPVTSSNAAVGTITASPVMIAGGSNSGVTQFHPVGSGSTTLTAGVAPALSTVTATVNTSSAMIGGAPASGSFTQIALQVPAHFGLSNGTTVQMVNP